MENYFKSQSAFGLDGNSSVAEIRPGFSENPLELTAKIQKIIEYCHEKAPDLEPYAGHYQSGFPIGGHIHFGLDHESQLKFNEWQLLLTLLDFRANLNLNEMKKRDQKVSKSSCTGGIIWNIWNVKI